MLTTRLRSLAPLLFALTAAGCASDAASDPETAQLKAQAEAQLKARHGRPAASGSSTPSGAGGTSGSPGAAGADAPLVDDPCAAHDWYADGVCDAWCPQGDADCGEPVVCPLYALLPDGVCALMGPCSRVNDPDCASDGVPPTGGGCAEPDPGGFGDGACEPASYDAFVADPDCRQLACPAIAGIPDGQCVAKTPCDYVIDPDCQTSAPPSDGVACIEIAYPADGACQAAPGCAYTDPDCAMACAAIAYPENGRCEAPRGCEANDPDCQ